MKAGFLFGLALTLALSIGISKAVPVPDQVAKIGTIKGKIVDQETKMPLAGVSIIVTGTAAGAKTDTSGVYTIKKLAVGNYSLQFSLIGYESIYKADIIVRPKRISMVDAELKVSAVTASDVIVTAGYFPETEDKPNSVVSYSAEEIRRAPGSAGDVSRIMMTLPSVAKVNDQMNSLIVRGGSPIENAFYIDNIEIPNINHYPTQGSSGGPIGLINVDFIKDATFSTGGFSSEYGDKLSSVMEIAFRDGNRDEFDAQLDFNFAGIGATAEGPLFNHRASYMVSARKSYLDLLVDAIGTGVAPRYSDYQGKFSCDISPSNKIELLEVLGLDYIKFDKDQSEEDGNIVYGSSEIRENAVGINWQHLWGKNGYSNLSISNMYTWYKDHNYETSTDNLLSSGTSEENSFYLRNTNHWRINKTHRVEFGFEAKYLSIDNNHFLAEYTDVLGDTIPEARQNDLLDGSKAAAFVNYNLALSNRLSTNLGVRADYFSINGNSHISPRFSITYRINDKVTLSGSTGIYYQYLPMSVLAYPADNRDLKDPKAYHYILGLTYMVTENTRLTVEAYDKQYRHFPMDPSQPSLFIADEIFYRYGFFFPHENLQSVGKAEAYGIEAYIQKKMAVNFYGLIGGSYCKSRYLGLDNVWRDRVFDNRVMFSAEGGYKPNNRWEYSVRWIFAGGAPFTPLDEVASANLNRGVFDANRINDSRYPAYHSLNIRCDRRFNFKGSNIIVYLSVWNAYNRQNVASYYWNETDRKPDVSYQWSSLPVFGFEYEF